MPINRTVPAEEGGSGSLVECNTVVPESTVIIPQISDAILLALCPDQSYMVAKQRKCLLTRKIGHGA